METQRLHLSKGGTLDIEFVESDVLERYDDLAREAIGECRKSIMMAMRFLNSALWHLPPEHAVLARALATNGRVLRFDPERVIERYRSEHELTRDCLHAVLHCLFHHPFEVRYGEYAAWSLACDIAVEACAMQLAGERFPSALDEERLYAIEQLRRTARNMTAPALYQMLRSGGPGEMLYLDNGLDDRKLTRLAELFKRDAHELWATHPRWDEPQADAAKQAEAIPDLQTQAQGTIGTESTVPRNSTNKSSQEGTPPPAEARESDGNGNPEQTSASRQSTTPKQTNGPTQESEPDMSMNADDAADEQTAAEWEEIAKRVQAEVRSQQYSAHGDGSLLQNLAIATRKPAHYDEFLQRFATIGEDMRISDDEFDYVYYTYGLSRYGNIPLVEPLEYQESQRVREFVIALDTSGSCSGELIRSFVERTYDILRQKTNFGDDVNVHLVQCDMRVRTATKVTSLAQLEEYADSFWVSGGGGTDFRPVFEYVDALVDSGEFKDLRGLVYFTDGYGTFPVKAPDYDVAFVFVDCDDDNVKVPGWAMKVIMTQEEVMQR